MKTKAKSESHFVSELADRITDNNRAAAMKKYLQSDAHFNVAKNRNGETGEVTLSFEAEYTRFSNR